MVDIYRDNACRSIYSNLLSYTATLRTSDTQHSLTGYIILLLPYKGLWRLDGGWDKLFGMAVSVNPGHRVLCVSRRKKEVLKKSEEKARRIEDI